MSGKGIHLEGLKKRYGEGDTAVDALKDVDMHVAPGEVVGLIGPSGSGKSTLLKCLGAVIAPTAGRMTLGEETIYDGGWKVRDLRALRRDKIGFVFQAPYLIPFLDVTDNVALLPMLAGVPNAEARAKALELLTALDVQHRARQSGAPTAHERRQETDLGLRRRRPHRPAREGDLHHRGSAPSTRAQLLPPKPNELLRMAARSPALTRSPFATRWSAGSAGSRTPSQQCGGRRSPAVPAW